MTESTLVFDVEIAHPIRTPGTKEWPGIEYASGWEDYAGMGIACVCCFDFLERRFRTFDQHTLRDFRQLMRERERVVGWNNHGFDNPLLEHHGCPVDPAASFDLMEVFDFRIGLEKAAAANGIQTKKSMPAAEAPIRWQQGRHAQVIDYCLCDVHITTHLYSKWRRQGHLMDPRTTRPTRAA